jgi:hypothetical protein
MRKRLEITPYARFCYAVKAGVQCPQERQVKSSPLHICISKFGLAQSTEIIAHVRCMS